MNNNEIFMVHAILYSFSGNLLIYFFVINCITHRVISLINKYNNLFIRKKNHTLSCFAGVQFIWSMDVIDRTQYVFHVLERTGILASFYS